MFTEYIVIWPTVGSASQYGTDWESTSEKFCQHVLFAQSGKHFPVSIAPILVSSQSNRVDKNFRSHFNVLSINLPMLLNCYVKLCSTTIQSKSDRLLLLLVKQMLLCAMHSLTIISTKQQLLLLLAEFMYILFQIVFVFIL